MKVKKVTSFNPKRPLVVRAEWSDGKVTEYDGATLAEDIRNQLVHHGLKQKLMDAHSGTYKETGSVADCRAVTDEVWAQLVAGDFNSERTGTPWIIECFVDLFDVEEDRAIEMWNLMDAATKKAAYKNPDVTRWKAERDLERAKNAESAGTAIDLKAMFAKK